jgi:hypothetical protein
MRPSFKWLRRCCGLFQLGAVGDHVLANKYSDVFANVFLVAQHVVRDLQAGIWAVVSG